MRTTLVALLLILAATARAQVDELPYGASEIRVYGDTYYYWNGDFYRRENGDYRRVEPPLGARVRKRPPAGTAFSIGDDHYFLSGAGTFFLYHPRKREFEVVSPPYNWRSHYRNPLAPEIPLYPRAYPPSSPPAHSERRPRRDDGAVREAYCQALAAGLARRDSRRREDYRRRKAYRDAYRRCLRESRRGRN